MKKIFIYSLFALTTLSAARAAGPVAVYGQGIASVNSSNPEAVAKERAERDAELKCAGPVVRVEVVDWVVTELGKYGPHCNYHGYYQCEFIVTDIAAKGLFVCRGNS